MENPKQSGRNLPPPAPQYRSHAVLPPQSPQIAPKTVQSETVSGSLKPLQNLIFFDSYKK